MNGANPNRCRPTTDRHVIDCGRNPQRSAVLPTAAWPTDDTPRERRPCGQTLRRVAGNAVLVVLDRVDLDDARVLQMSRAACLAAKLFDRFSSLYPSRMRKLDRHKTIQFRILGEIDGAETSLPQYFQDSIPANALTIDRSWDGIRVDSRDEDSFAHRIDWRVDVHGPAVHFQRPSAVRTDRWRLAQKVEYVKCRGAIGTDCMIAMRSVGPDWSDQPLCRDGGAILSTCAVRVKMVDDELALVKVYPLGSFSEDPTVSSQKQ